MSLILSGSSPNITSASLTTVSLTSPTISGTPVIGASLITTATSQTTTSGSSKVFTSIPSWVNRIVVMFSGVSTNGTNDIEVQIGTGATPTYVTSGYSSISSTVAIAGGTGGATSTSGFNIATASASSVRHGHMILTNVTGNLWVSSHTIGDSGLNFTAQGGGNISLAATLTAVRIITADTFDAGSVTITYE